MVDIEERRLRSLEEDVLSCLERAINEERRVGHVRERDFAKARQSLVDRGLKRRRLLGDTEGLRLLAHEIVEFLPQEVGMPEIPDAQTAAADLVLVGRTDAAAGGPDAARAELLLLALLLESVVRKNELRAIAQKKIGADFDALLPELLDLGEKRIRVDDASVSDDAGDAWVREFPRE